MKSNTAEQFDYSFILVTEFFCCLFFFSEDTVMGHLGSLNIHLKAKNNQHMKMISSIFNDYKN